MFQGQFFASFFQAELFAKVKNLVEHKTETITDSEEAEMETGWKKSKQEQHILLFQDKCYINFYFQSKQGAAVIKT